MFTWICPKCGSEVPPAYSECPNCAVADAPKPGTVNTASVVSPETTNPRPVVVEAPPAELRSSYIPQPTPVAPPPPTAHAAAPQAEPARRKELPSAVVAGLTMAGIAALLWLIYFVVIPKKANSIDAPEKGQTAATATSSTSQNPLAKHLEIAGVRLTGQGGRAQIQFVIVNHSAAELPELRLNIDMVAGDKKVFTFPFTAPSIGPFETRDLSTTVKTNLKPYEWPDWQVLRPQFRVLD